MYEIRVLDTDSMVVMGKNPNTQTKTCPSTTLSYMSWPGIKNPGLCSQKVEKIL